LERRGGGDEAKTFYHVISPFRARADIRRARMHREAQGRRLRIPVLNEDQLEELMKKPTVEELVKASDKVRPLHTPMGKIQPGDWLEWHPENGQTFREYLACDPVTAQGGRKTIYIQPLGEFTEGQRKIVDLTAEFMGLYFCLPVKVKEGLPLDLVPESERRIGPLGVLQLKTGYVRNDILRPRLPDDATVYIAFTASDLWPGPGWNFVFGEASLVHRVGVWSICRFGKPDGSKEEFAKTLLRTIKIGTHETGHMFTIEHCTAWECNMCGSNHLDESDRRPLWLCPECMPKVCYATGANPARRYRGLAKFCQKHGLDAQAAFYDKSAKALTGGE